MGESALRGIREALDEAMRLKDSLKEARRELAEVKTELHKARGQIKLYQRSLATLEGKAGTIALTEEWWLCRRNADVQFRTRFEGGFKVKINAKGRTLSLQRGPENEGKRSLLRDAIREAKKKLGDQ